MMSSFAKPPCDDAAILAGSEESTGTWNGPWILVATILGSSMIFIDGTVVNVVLPSLQAGFRASLANVQWVVESYALFLAALILMGGALGDRFGRRRMFCLGLMVFSIASAWCGLAPDIHQLIAARSLQGIGGALLVPGSLSLISAAFPLKERCRAIGTWSGFTSITAATGPVLGGWFTEHGSWRWVFFINLPLGVIALLVSIWKIPESSGGLRSQGFDWIGGLLAATGLGGIVFYWTTFFPAVITLGIGMAISVAPLSTTVMNAVDQSYTGAASGINNAVSRVAGLLAVAVLGALLSNVFESDLDRRLKSVDVSIEASTQIRAQRAKLAAAETGDRAGRQAIEEAFVTGYRSVLYVAVGLALASACTAAAMLTTKRDAR